MGQSLSRDALFSLVDKALKILPDLSMNGVGKLGTKGEGPDHCLYNEESLLWCVEWLAKIRPIRTPSISSYACKHMVERTEGGVYRGHVSNGCMIAAAVAQGYTFKIEGDSPNPLLGLSMRDVRLNDWRPGYRLWEKWNTRERQDKAIAENSHYFKDQPDMLARYIRSVRKGQ